RSGVQQTKQACGGREADDPSWDTEFEPCWGARWVVCLAKPAIPEPHKSSSPKMGSRLRGTRSRTARGYPFRIARDCTFRTDDALATIVRQSGVHAIHLPA